MTGPKRRALLSALAVVVTLLLTWVVFSRIPLASVLASLSRANAALVVTAVAAALSLNVLVSASALDSALLTVGARVSFRAALAATLGHLALHAGVGLAAGKAARAAFLVRAHGVEAKRAAAAEGLLLGLKVLALLLLAAGGALVAPWPGVPVVLPAVLVVVAALGIAYAVTRRYPDLRSRARDPERPGAGYSAGALVWTGLHALGQGALQLAVFWLCLTALGGHVSLPTLVARLPLCLLAAKLPLSVMGLGVREGLVVVAFAGLAPEAELLATSLLFGAIEQVLPGLVGLWFTAPFVRRIGT